MARKKIDITEPYAYNPHIFVSYEFPFGRDVMKPGDPIRIKNQRGVFTFIKVVHNAEKDVTWVDVMARKDGQFRSFYVTQIKKIERPKISRRKKQSV